MGTLLPIPPEGDLACPLLDRLPDGRGAPRLGPRAQRDIPPGFYRAESAHPRRPGRLTRLIPSPSVNLSYERSMRKLGQLLAAGDPALALALGSGSQRRELRALLPGHADAETVAVDVDARADVDLCFTARHDDADIGCAQRILDRLEDLRLRL